MKRSPCSIIDFHGNLEYTTFLWNNVGQQVSQGLLPAVCSIYHDPIMNKSGSRDITHETEGVRGEGA